MQNKNLFLSSEDVISSTQLAEDLQVTEEFIIKLCKKDLWIKSATHRLNSRFKNG